MARLARRVWAGITRRARGSFLELNQSLAGPDPAIQALALRRLDQHVLLLAEAEAQAAVGAEIGAADLLRLFLHRPVVQLDRVAADMAARLAAGFRQSRFQHQREALDAGIEARAVDLHHRQLAAKSAFLHGLAGGLCRPLRPP